MRRKEETKARELLISSLDNQFTTYAEVKHLESMTIMELVSEVVKGFKHCKNLQKTLGEKGKLLEVLGIRLAIAPIQALLMSIIIECDGEATLHEMAHFMDLNRVEMMVYAHELVQMVKLGLLMRKTSRHSRGDDYMIRKEVVKAMLDNHRYEPVERGGLTASDLMNEVDSIIHDVIENDFGHKDAIFELRNLFIQNRQNAMASTMLDIDDDDEMYILTYMCAALVKSGKTACCTSFVYRLYDDDRRAARKMEQDLTSEQTMIQLEGYIEFQCEDGQANNQSVCLTEEAREKLLSAYDIQKAIDERTSAGLVSYKEIEEKPLFYNKAEGAQIEELTRLLQQDNFLRMQEKLAEKAMRKGIACLLYGAPGTGKTESVYQLARQAGRDIVEIRVEQIKSKWVGDTEQNIRQAFRDYAQKVRVREVAPILLFNEADSILGLRKNGAVSGVDKMELSLQSIILQEMEKLEGVMICTTNLTSNLDKAFERRFIYKIEMKQPEIEVRSKIWRAMIPELNDEETGILARRFTFSGGQIENICRRKNINELLFDEQCDIKKLIQYCEQENIHEERKAVGF